MAMCIRHGIEVEQEGHLSICNSHWSNKETSLAFDRTSAQRGGVDQTECWEKESRVKADVMALLSETDAGQTHADKPQSSGNTH